MTSEELRKLTDEIERLTKALEHCAESAGDGESCAAYAIENERLTARVAELEARLTDFALLLIEYRREHVCHCSQHDLVRTCLWCRVDMELESAMEAK